MTKQESTSKSGYCQCNVFLEEHRKICFGNIGCGVCIVCGGAEWPATPEQLSKELRWTDFGRAATKICATHRA